MSKRVLIVAHAFVEGNMGGVRLRRIARALPRHGWEPVVLTHPRDTTNSYGPETGARFEEITALDLAKIYQKARTLGRRSSSPTSTTRNQPKASNLGLTSKINRWFMIPDKQITWYRAAVRRGSELLRHEKFDAIFASQDPRTCLLVAARLSRETDLPCILEYRDLWTGSPYHHLTQPTPLHQWIHARLERKVLRQARRVSAVCRGISEYLSCKYKRLLRAPIDLNYNFFDSAEYPPAKSSPPPPLPFTISYTGALYGSRGPRHFFEGLRRFLDETSMQPEQFRFRWAGTIAGIGDLDELLDRNALRPYVDFLGQIPHQEALRQLLQSHASLLIQAPDDAIHIPGKLFEAFGAKVPVLALTNTCETAEIINRCQAGIVCSHTASAVAAALGELHRYVTTGAPWKFNQLELQKFSADSAVGKLAALFEQARV